MRHARRRRAIIGIAAREKFEKSSRFSLSFATASRLGGPLGELRFFSRLRLVERVRRIFTTLKKCGVSANARTARSSVVIAVVVPSGGLARGTSERERAGRYRRPPRGTGCGAAKMAARQRVRGRLWGSSNTMGYRVFYSILFRTRASRGARETLSETFLLTHTTHTYRIIGVILVYRNEPIVINVNNSRRLTRLRCFAYPPISGSRLAARIVHTEARKRDVEKISR